jgi:TPP-dependent pyruvate/acetoin dehydrogenase alpha subunit
VRIKDMAKVDRLAVRGAAYGIPASTIDGNDPEIVAAAAESAIARAREGGGPTIIEAMTQRLVGHYTGDSQHYRPAGEVATASEDEPLVRLLARSMNDPSLAAKFQAIRTEIGQEIDEAVEEARRTPFPHASTAKDHLYA